MFEIRNIRLGWLARGTTINKEVNEQMNSRLAKGAVFAAVAALSIRGASYPVYAAEDVDVEGTLGFARLEDESAYVNVRAGASTESGEVVGILENGDSAVIESVEEDGWYRIRSGELEGYVASRLIATGEEAEAIAAESAYTYAKVNAESLNVRAEESGDAQVIGTLEQGDQAEVTEDYDGGAFVRVCVDADTYGYVSADYVELATEYPTGKTLEQIAAEEEALESAADAEWTEDASETSWEESSADSGSDPVYTETTYTDTGSQTGETAYTDPYSSSEDYTDSSAQQSSDTAQTVQTEAQTEAQTQTTALAASASGSAIASYACQYVGIPYVWGGSSLSSGVDCSGFTMCVFSHFGISLPHFAASQYGCGTPVSLSNLAPGDLVFYNGSSGSIEHVAIYVGGGSIVHARGTGYGVCYSSLNYDTPDAACRVV